ncbi:kinase-like protein [Phlebopus sp. FC_14]|nr:kinase-like protein [Phlebopus sp. FC_14]
MSLSWVERKDLLGSLLQAQDDDEEGLALDRILHGQNTIGKTSKTITIDSLRFSDKDLSVLRSLEQGQFGVVDLVNCTLDGRVYVRKSIEKSFALRTREQCFPQFEREILLLARRNDTIWAPHLLCAFQTSMHLNLVMDYAGGGTLWDVLESSPHNNKLLESDLRWWAPQAVCAIHWCHSQGFAHRDIKPHNFVLTSTSHLLLIDFGSAAPLLPPEPDGTQLIAQQYSLVPCGTCDYISPEILQAHEDALVALEFSNDNSSSSIGRRATTCGLETDWWSLGVMLYELLYGTAPFFANEVRTTYLRIMDHETSLRFNKSVAVSESLRNLLQGLLTKRERRLGRCSVSEIMEHSFFRDTNWSCVGRGDAPPGLHMPQFLYSAPTNFASCDVPPKIQDDSYSQPFGFSAFFQSSANSGLSILRKTPHEARRSVASQSDAAFIGFSWGPPKNAFHSNDYLPKSPVKMHTSAPTESIPFPAFGHLKTSPVHLNTIATPVRPHNASLYHTLPRTSTVRRTSTRRALSDREAMKQLVDCVGMSARKKVLASGRKPRILDLFNRSHSVTVKELRFAPHPAADRTYDSSDFPPIAFAVEPEGTESGSEGPPSPSPSPRPGSAMSMLSRRSVTPTVTGFHSTRVLSLPSLSRSAVIRENEHESLWNDKALDRLEDRHAAMISELCDIELRLHYLRAAVKQ